ncbi:MAG: GPW/gp25 family protein [Chitinophagales bacterium]|nr:GPW/gp25 family protein [Chitinophagales bacterium]
MEDNKSFLGTGWGFPICFDYASSTVNMASEVEDIEESLTILLNTRPGERVMRPDYGCGLQDLMFEPLNESLITYIKDLISKAILFYEPRVQLRNIDIVSDPANIQEGKVLIELDFVVRTTNSRYNYVFDFYKREATIQASI